MNFEEKVIDINGNKTFYLTGGAGAPLVYLHGAGGDAIASPFLQELAKNFQVYIPTHPGFAASEGMEKIENVHDLVFHYVEFFDKLGLEKFNLIGLSLGGWLAAELAVHHNRRIEKLALIGAMGLKLKQAPMTDFFALPPFRLREYLFHNHDRPPATSILPDNPSPEVAPLIFRANEASVRIGWRPRAYFCDPRLQERLYRISAGTMVLWGDNDRIMPREHALAYQAGIKNARLTVLADCGHLPALEKPEESARVLGEFFLN